ncbi:tyrosine-type recombinase/integrase [Micromonospora sp. WMMD980]|uniref:site-specific integrase n=1 Tax=Micromonospora sp. WMMD980 TaxID=3016088 RepID=UPI002417447A|nr:tyrosine-type recombinase/integrase [Micromonospora sp. WMMD980]MDG4799279.1 tyrosine-type recombinase/integrase [Micromonospora sp. WMMD980]
MRGSVFRRCACRDPQTGKQYGQSCPKLTQRRHGTWGMRQELPPTADGERRTFRRSGYASATEAQADLDGVRALLAVPDTDDVDGRQRMGDLFERAASNREPLPDLEETRRKFRSGQSLTARITVGEWLDTWIAGRKIRRNTLDRYGRDIRLHLKPHIGDVRLDRLRVSHLSEMFNAIVERNIEIEEANALRRAALDELKALKGRDRRRAARAAIAEMPPFRRTVGPTTRRHIRATLRAALNDAVTQELITFNPAAHVELDPVRRPKALVWTDERVARWRATGERPSPVMVWTPEQTGAFLDFIADDELYALFHLIALRGLRRGEACGLRPEDLDLKGGTVTVATQLVEIGGEIEESEPKSDAGNRIVALDAGSLKVTKRHIKRQQKAREKASAAWVESGRLFTRPTGAWVEPDWLSDYFDRLVRRSGLPPIRLHDLRHGAATIALAAGTEMKVVQEMLGHSSISLTSDTYTSVLPELAREAAEAAARLVPRQRSKRPAGLTSGTQHPSPSASNNGKDRKTSKKQQVKRFS